MPAHHPAVQRVVEAALSRGVEIDVVTFEQSTHTAQEAAAAVGAELGQIVKSLVFVAPGVDAPEPYLALVGGVNTVDMARLAQVVGVPRLRRSTADEARQLTGFAIGGIPPFGHSRPLRTVMDPRLADFETVWAAAGRSTAVFEIAPGTLRELTDATVARIGAEPAAAGASQPERAPGQP